MVAVLANVLVLKKDKMSVKTTVLSKGQQLEQQMAHLMVSLWVGSLETGLELWLELRLVD
jgi:hypothetical protein